MTEEQATLEPITVKTSPISPTQKGMGIFSRLLSFSPLGPKTENPVQKSPKEEEPSQVYYGVYIPCESKIGADEGLLLLLHKFFWTLHTTATILTRI